MSSRHTIARQNHEIAALNTLLAKKEAEITSLHINLANAATNQQQQPPTTPRLEQELEQSTAQIMSLKAEMGAHQAEIDSLKVSVVW
jgi:predicted RNase H-like nuclease (RuvC/YqgF family)